MALLTPKDLDVAWATARQATTDTGDWYKGTAMARLWFENADASNDLVVTVTEQVRCDHEHHGLINKTYTIASETRYVLPVLDLTMFGDENRYIQLSYDQENGAGPTLYWVALYWGQE